MPGPWINGHDNPGFTAGRKWEPKELFESLVFDNSVAAQGKALWRVNSVEPPHGDGRWLTASLVAVEDKHLKWWITRGGGNRYNRTFRVHLCHETVSKCKCYDRKIDGEFHTDYVRMLDLDDIRTRRVAWWLTGAAKGDFEKFRHDISGKGGGADPGGDDEEALDLEESEMEMENIPSSSKAKKTGLGAELEKLKSQTLSSPAGRKEKRKEREGVTKPKKSSPERRKEKKKKKDESSEEPAKREKRPKWFGREPDEKKGQKKRKARSEDQEVEREASEEGVEKKKKKKPRRGKSKKPPDRGPYGAGVAMDFDDDEDEETSSSEEEGQIFRGGVPDKRSHQLRLMEYALTKPGRLTSRLLQKMQALLSRETGAPFQNQSGVSNLTPPVATSYLQTILIPNHRSDWE